MGKIITGVLITLFLFIGASFSSCSLHYWVDGEIYFYQIAGEGNEDSRANLLSKKNGYTIIMSRGKDGKTLDKTEAEELAENTVFTLALDDLGGSGSQELEGGEIGTDKLGLFGNDGWHVVQSFETGPLPKGSYELTGITEGIRNNTVTLKVR